MKRRLADALYWAFFPGNRVLRYSWPAWNLLCRRGPLGAFILRHESRPDGAS